MTLDWSLIHKSNVIADYLLWQIMNINWQIAISRTDQKLPEVYF